LKILLITREPPLLSEEIVSGNAVRTGQISHALRGAGHHVTQAWLCGKRRQRPGTFRNRDELQGILIHQKPDVILVSYWELLAELPFENAQAVILDFVAPRPLEELYESPGTVRDSLHRLRLGLARCDLVLVGNELQRHLLINTMIEAGFDLRKSMPLIVVPLGAEVIGPPKSEPGEDGWLLVTGGVTWPWRRTEPYSNVLEETARICEPEVKIVHFGGEYRWHEKRSGTDTPDTRPANATVDYRALEPYRHFSDFLTRNAHIGVELAQWNIERQYSQSFRSLEFLRHGLPLLCNRYLPIASLVQDYDAGWTVDDPESLRMLLPTIVQHQDAWMQKSENALKLVTEALQPDRSVEPLLNWLSATSKAVRLDEQAFSGVQEPVLGIPPLKERAARQLKLIRQVLFSRVFGQTRGGGVLFVTRGDLFPADHGAAVRIVQTARALSIKGIKVGIVTDEVKHWFEICAGEVVKRKYPAWVRFLSMPGAVVKLLHYSKDIPLSNGFLYLPLSDTGFLWRTIAAAKRIHAGTLQAEFPAYAQPCIKARQALNCSVVLVEHNVEYNRLKSQVNELTDEQYNNLKAIEISLCNTSDAVVCVSDNDRQKLAEDGVKPELLFTIPHGVDLEQYAGPPTANVRQQFGITADEPLLVFHGTFSYPPNREALRIFSEILLPGLEGKGLKCHVLAVGRNPPANSPHRRIHFTGSVSEVAPWLKAADICVIPLTDGGGTRMKIVDCFAAALPVISTSKGIEGIPVVSGQHALVLDEWESIMAAIVDLWRNPEQARSLADGGRAMAESLDWSVIAQKYISIYSTLN
jgi:glycosyltransferase involved in cell wall biosynthesis